MTTLRFNRILSILASSLIVALCATGIGPAAADGELDALSIVEKIAPGILSETSVEANVEAFEGGAIEVPPILVEGGGATGIDYTIDYVSGVSVEPEKGITEYQGIDESVSALVQNTDAGVRTVTIIEDGEAPEEYSYTFDVPDDSQLSPVDGGYLIESRDDFHGLLLDAWAIDARGVSVPTYYAWEAGKLTQYVDLSSPYIEYPVIADPAWGYNYYFDVTKTPAQAKSLLKRCFSCFFPVSGAPKGFPKNGQILPLRVAGLNFECKFRSEFSAASEWGYTFNATPKHVDGYGSSVIFKFYRKGGKNKLMVSAYIRNDAIWIKNAFYRSGAIQKWTQFANNISRG